MFRSLILSSVVALLVAGQAHSQDVPICSNGRAAPATTVGTRWHTTLGAGQSYPQLWQVGYLNGQPRFEVNWEPVLEFVVPTQINLAKRYIVNVDLVVDPKAVEGGDAFVGVGLMGDGFGDTSKMSASQLNDLAHSTDQLQYESFFLGDGAPQVIWVDELASTLEEAIQGRQKYLSLHLTPFGNEQQPPTYQVRISSAYLKVYHCPL